MNHHRFFLLFAQAVVTPPAQQPTPQAWYLRPPLVLALLAAAIAIVSLSLLVRSRRKYQKETLEALSKVGYESVNDLLEAVERRQFAEQVKQRVLESAGLGPVPTELASALSRLNELKDAFPMLKGIRYQDGGQHYSLLKYSYTSIGAVENMQTALAAIAAAHIGQPKDPPNDLSNRYFDAFTHPEYAVCNEALYTFPFFLTWQRRSTWGVIPYARHRNIGVAIHPSHPAYKLLAPLDVASKKLRHTPIDIGNAHWIASLFAEVAGLDGKVYSVEGYLHQEIIPLSVLATGNDATQSQYLRYATAVPGQAHGVPIPPQIYDGDRRGRDVAIVDLAERQKVMQAISPHDFRLLALPHGLPIPVGIGFSLLMLPLLLKNNVWMHLAKVTQSSLAVEGIEREMADAGIELDWSLIGPPEER